MSEIVDYSARAFPTPTGGQMIFLAVLTLRQEGTYKAYAAIVPDNSEMNGPDYENACAWTQRKGSPLLPDDAKALFRKLQVAGSRYAE